VSPVTKPTMPNDYPAGSVVSGPAPMSGDVLSELDEIGVVYDVSFGERAVHGRDWWPLSIPEVAAGRVPLWPGVVVRPATTKQVSDVITIAARHVVPLTAQGGRSSVLGGAMAPEGGIALDMTGLNRILEIDELSGTVSVEAGVFGPALEAHVNERGWTVGHFPQSFELATVGGWLACRGAGQYSNRYGKIEDMVRGLTVVLANGDVVEIGDRGPRQAVGPDLLQLFVGSEGCLGIITRATLVLQRKPEYEERAAYGFGSFADGLDACRRIFQRGARPAVLRLYDESESKRIFDTSTCMLIVLDEGDRALVSTTMMIVDEECSNEAALESTHVATWLTHRNDVSALASLWEHGIVVDTIEVSGPWSTLTPMQERVCAAVSALPSTLVVTVHQSHAYLDGACLYFTFAGCPETDPVAYYRLAWDVAIRAALSSGGTLSHHHGVGRNRARFVKEALGSAYPLLKTLKKSLDPLNLLNPGVLGVGGEPW
jgi:alkyldihydroxyacetonephosphate synthase